MYKNLHCGAFGFP